MAIMSSFENPFLIFLHNSIISDIYGLKRIDETSRAHNFWFLTIFYFQIATVNNFTRPYLKYLN